MKHYIIILMLLLSCFTVYGTITDGDVVIWYNGSQTVGTEPENVKSPGTYDGQYLGGAEQSASGLIGPGFFLDGADDYINTTYISFASNFTVAVWFNFISINGDFDAIWSSRENNGNGITLANMAENNPPGWLTFVDNDIDFTGFGNQITGVGWTLITATYNSSDNLCLYINTTFRACNANVLAGHSNFLEIGRYYQGYTLREPHAYVDEFVVFNRGLTNAEITDLFNSGKGRNFSYYVLSPPVTSNYNVTSDSVVVGESTTSWNTGGLINLTTNLLSFTFDADTNSNCSCRLDTEQNYSGMIAADSNYKLATTDTTSHAGTLYDDIGRGNHCMYCSCITSGGTENATGVSTTGCLNITFNNQFLTMYQNNVEASRKYELQTTAALNASSNYTLNSSICLDFESDNFGKNYSCQTYFTNGTGHPYAAFNYSELNLTYKSFTRDDILQTLTYIALGNSSIKFLIPWTRILEVDRIKFNFSGSGSTPNNITIDIGNNSITDMVFPGDVVNERTNITRFSNGLTAENLSFVSAGSRIRYINYSTESPVRITNLDTTLKLSGFTIDTQTMNFNEFFWNSTWINFSNGQVPQYYHDDFSNGLVSGRWETNYDSGWTTELKGVSGQHVISQDGTRGSGTCADKVEQKRTGEFWDEDLDMSNFTQVTVNAAMVTNAVCLDPSCIDPTSGKGISRVGLRDDTGVTHLSKEISSSCSATSNGDSDSDSDNSTYTWQFRDDGFVYFNGVKDFAYSEDREYYFWGWGYTKGLGPGASGSTTVLVHEMNVSGLTGTYTNNLTWSKPGNYTSVLVGNNTENVSRVKLTTVKRNLDGGTETLWVSNDNGSTWEETTSGVFHSFSTEGKGLKVRINLTITDADDPFTIDKYNLQVVPSTVQNVSIDVGNDGVADYNMSGILNETNSPQNVTLNASPFFDYIAGSDCEGLLTCLVPVRFQVDSPGSVQYGNVVAGQNLSNVWLNTTLFENYANQYCFESPTHYTIENSSVSDLEVYDIGDRWWAAPRSTQGTLTGYTFNHGTLGGGITLNDTGGIYGSGAYKFNGATQYIDLGSKEVLNINNSGISLTAWIKMTSLADTFNTIYGKSDANTIGGYLWRIRNTPRLEFRFNNAQSTYNYAFSANVTYFVGSVFNGSHVNFYVNNAIQCSVARADKINKTAQNAYVGALRGSSQFFPGYIDNLMVWNRSLSTAEIFNEYANQTKYGAVSGDELVFAMISEPEYDNSTTAMDTNMLVTSTNASDGTTFLKGALNCDGKATSVRTTSERFKTPQQTWSLWANSNSVTNSYVITYGSGGASRFSIRFQNSDIGFYDDILNEGQTTWFYNTYTQGDWVHLVIVFYEGGSKFAYVNGEYAGSDGSGGNLTRIAGTGILELCDIIGSNIVLNGTIDEVRVFNRTLSQAEITSLYTSNNYSIPVVDCNVTVRVQSDSAGTLKVGSPHRIFYGGDRFQVNATLYNPSGSLMDTISRYVTWRYSPFLEMLPIGIDYYDVFPSSHNAKDVQPYGQKNGTSIWNLTATSHMEDTDITVCINNTLPDCVTVEWANNYAGTDSVFLSRNLTSLVSYYRFENYTQNLSKLYDSSGNSQDGTLNGYTRHDGTLTGGITLNTTGGKYGGAYEFNGDLDKDITIPYHDVFNWSKQSSGTIAFWYYPLDSAESDYVISRYNAVGQRSWLIYQISNGLRFYTSSGIYLSANNIVSNKEWVHFIAHYNGSHSSIYVNGTLVSGPTAKVLGTSPLGVAIGSPDSVTTRGANFYMDNLQFYVNITMSNSVANNIYKNSTLYGPPVGDGLVANYIFEPEYDNSTTAVDTNPMITSTNMSDNVTFLKGAMRFDGVNDYVNLTSGVPSLDGTTAFTISMWIYKDKVGNFANHDGLFSRGTTAQRTPWIWGFSGAQYVRMQFESDIAVSDCDASSPSNIPLRDWTHIVAVWNGSHCYFVQDLVKGSLGVVEGTTLVDTDGFNYIGYMNAFGYWNGSIDEVMIYNRSLSDGEITNLYNSVPKEYFRLNKTFNTQGCKADYTLATLNSTTESYWYNWWNFTSCGTSAFQLLEFNATFRSWCDDCVRVN